MEPPACRAAQPRDARMRSAVAKSPRPARLRSQFEQSLPSSSASSPTAAGRASTSSGARSRSPTASGLLRWRRGRRAPRSTKTSRARLGARQGSGGRSTAGHCGGWQPIATRAWHRLLASKGRSLDPAETGRRASAGRRPEWAVNRRPRPAASGQIDHAEGRPPRRELGPTASRPTATHPRLEQQCGIRRRNGDERNSGLPGSS
jgi:hypothetical protein